MVGLSPYMLVFRVLHIVSGIFWVGSAFFVTVFLEPTAGELGPAAGPVMVHLMEKRKVGQIITGIAAFTVIGGLFLYWRDWHTYASFGDWIGSAFGAVLTVGAVTAIAAFALGAAGIPPTINQMNTLGKEMAEAGGPPPPEKMAAMTSLQHRLKVISRTDLVLVTIAIFAMATARYW
ncbi:MAG: hypothetical protein QOI81_1700 [Actinomycetota bacterium]|nr:hypothetical protein [Actinomycetota bacterium]